MPIKKWNNNYIWKCYQLAASGLSDLDICDHLQISKNTMLKWKKEHKSLKNGLSAARRSRKRGIDFDWKSFIYGRLPECLREYWDYLQAEEQDCRGKQITMEGNMMLFLHAWYTHDFNITEACRIVGVARLTYNHWRKTHVEFAELCDQMMEIRKDYVESSVMRLIRSGDSAATIHASKTLNRDRGYSEKVELDVSGSMNVNVNVINVDDLNLSVETRREILTAYREQQKGE